MSILILLIISFAFFTQSLLGFGGGLISIPLLSLVMPIQEAVAIVMVYQFSMGLLIFKTYHHTKWHYIFKMLPMTVVGVCSGVILLSYLDGDIIRALLALYIIFHLIQKHTKFDPLGRLVKWGGAHLAGFLGGILNAMIGGGGPAFILYLKEKITIPNEFRASIIAILVISNIPRAIGMVSTSMLTIDLFITSLYAFPAFLFSIYLGQKFHDKIPQKQFFIGVEILLGLSAILLIIKILL